MKRNLLILIISILAFLFLSFTPESTLAWPLNRFNTGTNQGWKYDVGAAGGKIIPSSPFLLLNTIWSDIVNYPNDPLFDPSYDDKGSIGVSILDISNELDELNLDPDSVIIRFISYDLSDLEIVQNKNMDGFSCQVTNTMNDEDAPSCFVNLWVKLEDQDGEDRYFYNGDALPNNDFEWTKYTYSGLKVAISNAQPEINDYTIKRIAVYVHLQTTSAGGWWDWGGVYVDNVVPVWAP